MLDQWGVAAWVNAVGIKPTAALTVTKLAWVRAHEPEAFGRIRYVLLPHDYLTFRLTGSLVTDRSDASGTGYFGLDGAWQTEVLTKMVSDAPPWGDMLPEVLGPNAAAGTVSSAVAEELGFQSGVVVAAGGGDQHLGAVGLGLKHGEVAFSLGTSGVVLTPSLQPVVDETGWIDSVADATGGFLPLVCTLNSTKVTDTFARLLDVPIAKLGAMALAVSPTHRAPTLLAYLDGERSPAHPRSQGVLAGITTATSREEVALSAFQGVVSGLARGHAALSRAGLVLGGDVVVTGGGARSDAYLQLLADTLGTEVVTRRAPDATSRGACIQAAAVVAGARVEDVREEWVLDTVSRVAPRIGSTPGISDEYLAEVVLDQQRDQALQANSVRTLS